MDQLFSFPAAAAEMTLPAGSQSEEGDASGDVTPPPVLLLRLKMLDERVIDLTVRRDITVAEFRVHVERATQVPIGLQRLIYRGKLLKDGSSPQPYDTPPMSPPAVLMTAIELDPLPSSCPGGDDGKSSAFVATGASGLSFQAGGSILQAIASLRDEQRLYQERLHDTARVTETIRSIYLNHGVDAVARTLLSWWTPPSTDFCFELAREALSRVECFRMPRGATSVNCWGWKVQSHLSRKKGLCFSLSKCFVDSPSRPLSIERLAQTIWDARADSAAASRLGVGFVEALLSVVAQVNDKMIIVHRTLRDSRQAWCVRTLYLLFWVEHEDGRIDVISRDLDRTASDTWDANAHRIAEDMKEEWVDCFTWTTFRKLNRESWDDRLKESLQPPADESTRAVWLVDYAGNWPSAFAVGMGRWQREMLLMVLRWQMNNVEPVVGLA
ncbi:hypothetical protein P43SY_004223 [Pythium insidiosum]|uniref:Ubiquitin-like domain-containing protein n=1 Tax=Pythium insidiosum TaxID=114742 RepID=A0AAD5LGL0_PYTIN|nr:hypothetical protein P43SY_004223 [Pythium insidiosum]